MSEKFGRWKSDPFLALTMYHQLRTAFGWESYKKVFAEYRDLPKNQRPKNDDEERDQWLVRFSLATGKTSGHSSKRGVFRRAHQRAIRSGRCQSGPPDWPKP